MVDTPTPPLSFVPCSTAFVSCVRVYVSACTFSHRSLCSGAKIEMEDHGSGGHFSPFLLLVCLSVCLFLSMSAHAKMLFQPSIFFFFFLRW